MVYLYGSLDLVLPLSCFRSFIRKCPLNTINPNPIILTVVVDNIVIITGSDMDIVPHLLNGSIDA